MECHVVEPHLADLDVGTRCSVVVNIEWKDQDHWVLGETVHRRQKIWIRHGIDHLEDTKVTFLDVVIVKAGPVPSAEMDGMSFHFPRKVLTPEVLCQVVETCTGLGALGKGAIDAGFKVMVQNEIRSEICDFLELQQGPVIVRGDIGETATVATILRHAPSAGVLTAGVSCQPFSKLGDRRGAADDRSNCLPKVLRAAYLMQSSIVVLECVADVTKFPAFEECIRAFCRDSGFHYERVLLELGDVWVSRRHRWWGVLSKGNFGPFKLFDWQGIRSSPKISLVLNNFDTVPPHLEQQLRLTLYELRSIHELGTLHRYTIRIDQQAPTAVHAWGSHFYGCRCGCRSSGLALERLQRDGIHVLLIPTGGMTKHMGMELPHMRYPSGAECALLNGLSPNMEWGKDARLGLCLVGQLASPMQSAWILSHVRQHLAQRGLVPPCQEGPLEVLSMQRTKLIAEAEQGGFFRFPDAGIPPVIPFTEVIEQTLVEAPAEPSRGVTPGHFIGILNGVEQLIPFRAGCRIWHWVQAELALYPVDTKFFCGNAQGEAASLNEEIGELTRIRLDIIEGEGVRRCGASWTRLRTPRVLLLLRMSSPCGLMGLRLLVNWLRLKTGAFHGVMTRLHGTWNSWPKMLTLLLPGSIHWFPQARWHMVHPCFWQMMPHSFE